MLAYKICADSTHHIRNASWSSSLVLTTKIHLLVRIKSHATSREALRCARRSLSVPPPLRPCLLSLSPLRAGRLPALHPLHPRAPRVYCCSGRVASAARSSPSLSFSISLPLAAPPSVFSRDPVVCWARRGRVWVCEGERAVVGGLREAGKAAAYVSSCARVFVWKSWH